jgi:antitoxin (DNA-binding transcriptional repressor) of toxin-antitoxin stability system
MLTITYRELRNAPAKVDRVVQSGKTVRVTRRGKTHFEIHRPGTQSAKGSLAAKLAAIFGEREFSTKELVQSLRQSRE